MPIKSQKILAVFALLSILLSVNSCVHVSVMHASGDYNNDLVKTATLRLIVSSNIKVKEFKKTFGKLYTENSDCARTATQMLTANMYTLLPLAKVKTGDFSEAEYYDDSSEDSTFISEQAAYFSEIKEDYALVVSEIEISNSWQYNAGPNGGGSSSESCVTNSTVSLIRLRDKQNMFTVKVTGEQKVNFFAYQDALVGAIDKNMRRIAKYINDGKVKY